MIRPRRVDIAFAGGVLLGLAALWILGFFAIRDRFVAGNDFAFIWAGPAALVQGSDPYDPATWRTTTEALGAEGERVAVYDYPAWTTLGLLPLGVLPLAAAAAIWAYGGLVLAIIAMLALAREELARVPGTAFAVGFMTVASQPAIVNFYDGEWSLILVAGLVAVVIGLRTRRQALGAFGLLALAAKPNPFLIAFPALLRAALARGQPRFVAIVIGAGVLMLAATLVVLPRWIAPYAALIGSERLANPKTTVLPFALRELFGDAGLVIGVLILLAAVAVALRFDPRADAYVPAWLAVAPLVTPYLHSYDQLVLIVPTTVAIGALARRDRRLAYALAAFACLDLVIVAPLLIDKPALELGRETLNAFIAAPLALLVLAALWRGRRSVA